MDLLAHPADHRDRFAEIDLGVPRRVRQRHEHLARLDTGAADIVPHHRHAARIAVLVAQALEDTSACVALFDGSVHVGGEDRLDHAQERIELRADGRS